MRKKGYWEAIDDAKNGSHGGHNVSTNDPSRLSLTPSSDRIVQWNTPKLVPIHGRTSSVAGATQLQSVSGATNTSLGKGKHRACSSMSGLQLDNSENHSATDGKTTQVPMDKAHHLERSSTIQLGCLREERLQNQAQLAVADRNAARRRRQRKSLKESGDYLGVQGVNPLTGKPDHITPFSSDERSELSIVMREDHFHIPPDFTSRNPSGDEKLVGDVKGENLIRRHGREKVADGTSYEKKRDGLQWPSVQEPNLSPVSQSSSGKEYFPRPHQPFVLRGVRRLRIVFQTQATRTNRGSFVRR